MTPESIFDPLAPSDNDRMRASVGELEMELRQTRAQLTALLHNAPAGFALLDLDLRLLHINDRLADICGLDTMSLIGRPVAEILPSQGDAIREVTGRVLATGEPVFMNLFSAPRSANNGNSPQWNERWFPVSDNKGEIVGFGVAEDLSGNRHSEGELDASAKELCRLKAALDEHAIVAITDATGRITHANDKFCKISRFSREELLGKDHRILNSSYHSKEFIRDLWMTITRGQVWHGEVKNLAKDGTCFWLDTTIVPFLDEGGRPREYVSIRTDITERKRADEALEHAISLLKATLESTADGLLVVDNAGRITNYNQHFVDLWSLPPELLASGDDEAALQYVTRQLKNPDGFLAKVRELYAMPETCSSDLIEFKDGRVIERYSQAQWLDGKAVGRVWSFRDVTARIRAEAALRGSERFARSQWAEAEAILEAIPANIAILDADGKIIRVNGSWTAFAAHNGGIPTKTRVGSNYLAACDAAEGSDAHHAKRFGDSIRRVLAGNIDRFSMEYPCHSPDAQRWYMGYVTAAPGEGTARAVVAHVDISAQKRVEEQIRHLNEALELRVTERTADLQSAVTSLESEILNRLRLEREILAISEREQRRIGQDLHDGLGQELAGISLISKTLAVRLATEEHPTADVANNVSRYIREAIESTRRLAKGLYPVELSRYGLMVALEDLASQTSRRFGIRCELIQHTDLPKLDDSVAIHLYRIIQECIGNAIKHGMAERIVIESRAEDGNHDFVVTDNGVGFNNTNHSSGMGLHLMEYRARIIGARLVIEKPPAGGCRVSCRLS